jgi:hypothetical protein
LNPRTGEGGHEANHGQRDGDFTMARPFLETAIPVEARAGPDSLARIASWPAWRVDRYCIRRVACTLYMPRGVSTSRCTSSRKFAREKERPCGMESNCAESARRHEGERGRYFALVMSYHGWPRRRSHGEKRSVTLGQPVSAISLQQRPMPGVVNKGPASFEFDGLSGLAGLLAG